jgi:hypothetical protein
MTIATDSSLISLATSHDATIGPIIRAATISNAAASVSRPRRMSPEAGRGLEILGHAIEYLGDEFALDCMSGEAWIEAGLGSGIGSRLDAGVHPRLAAIELLKERNREIYFSCPEVPTLAERLRSWLGLRLRLG